jgi:hypothetical protein
VKNGDWPREVLGPVRCDSTSAGGPDPSVVSEPQRGAHGPSFLGIGEGCSGSFQRITPTKSANAPF